jgi:hypothetical protein
MPKKKENKRVSRKEVYDQLWSDNSSWIVKPGRLGPGPGRPSKTGHLFKHIAEKLPFASLHAVWKHMQKDGALLQGVYLAHDSMGIARYGGRGAIFSRLFKHWKSYPHQLLYFSFYVIANKSHERGIETAILRAAGAQTMLNTRKVAYGLHPGNIADYEPGTMFYERQRIRGRKLSKSSSAKSSSKPT